MSGRLERKTALITGCNRGIGKAILEIFAKEGADIIACTRKADKEQNLFYNRIENDYEVTIFPIYFDMGDIDSLNNGIKQILNLKKSIQILVNNAGKAISPSVLKINQEQLLEVFQINYFSPILMIKGILKLLVKAKGASIVNMGSVIGINGELGGIAYGASKAALINSTKTMSKELAPLKVRVNCIAPGYIDTDMGRNVNYDFAQEKIRGSSFKRFGTPEEVANTALFLASDESSYITGQTFIIDGGL